jgi:hypothetical protein
MAAVILAEILAHGKQEMGSGNPCLRRPVADD